MANFDPYRKWLGIPPEEQPPHHYRLLGVGLFESDPDVIANAADRQMVHVRSFQTGQYAAESQQMLNELAAARLCLLDPQRRALYDAALKLKHPVAPAVPVTAVPPAPMPPAPGAPPLPPGTPPQLQPHVPPPPPGRIPQAVAAPVAGMPVAPAGRGPAARSYPVRRRSQNWQVPVIVFGVVAVVGLGLALMVVMDRETPPPEAPPRQVHRSHSVPDPDDAEVPPRPERGRPRNGRRAELPSAPPSPQPPPPVQGFVPLGPARLGEMAAMPGHGGPVLVSAFSPDGLFAATGGQDKTVRLWDPVAGRQLRQLPGAQHPVIALEFSRDGRFVYALAGPPDAAGGAICIWDVGLGGSPKSISVAEGRQVQCLAIDPNGQLAAVGCHDGSIRLIDLETQAEARALSGHAGPVHAVTFSRDGAAVVSGGEDGAVLAFHSNTGTEVRRFAGHRGPVRAVAISPDGADAASGGDDHMVRLWELRGNKARAELRGHEQPVTSFAYDAKGDHAVSVDRGGRLILWQIPQLREERRFDTAGGPILSVAAAPDGSRAVLACQDGMVRLWGLTGPAGAVADGATVPGEAGSRPAAPAEDVQKQWRDRIQAELFRAEFKAAQQPDQKAALAKQLMERAVDSQTEADAAHALLNAAADLAVEAGDLESTFRAVDGLAERYDVDVLAEKLARLQGLATKGPESLDRNTLAARVLQTADEAVMQDRFDVGRQLVDLARTTLGTLDDAALSRSVGMSGDAPLLRSVEAAAVRLDAARQAYEALADARNTLTRQPDDPQAALAVGKYECFTKGNWAAGLPLLAQGADEQLARIAAAELKQPTDPASVVALGDDWWQVAEGRPALAQTQIRWHAAALYKQVAEKLTDPKVREQTRARILAAVEPGAAAAASDPPPSVADLAACRTEQNRAALLRYYGGSEQTEAAVHQALLWIAVHQFPDGSWNFDHRGARARNPSADPGALDQAPNTATALALLAFLGAGHSPRRGEFRRNVGGGLNFLRGRMTPAGPDAASLYEAQAGFLPSHAMATCALCEAVALTADPQSQKAAQNAVNFLVNTQNPDGGWSLRPSLPDQPGGTSDFFTTTWSLMALKTAQWVGLRVPDTKLKLAGSYLDNLRTASGGGFLRQRSDSQADATASAAGALAHVYLGRVSKRLDVLQLVGGAAEQGPALAGHFYQDLCAAQVLREVGGPPWTKFHTALRDSLLETQAGDGPEKGSWFLESVGWGNHVGGRLFCTAMAALSLETYYRFPPLALTPK